MTPTLLEARRGRPSIEGLRGSIERARDRNDDLRDEIRAERLEGVDLAKRMRDVGTRLETAGKDLGSPTVLQAGLELGYHAARYLRQRSGSAL